MSLQAADENSRLGSKWGRNFTMFDMKRTFYIYTIIDANNNKETAHENSPLGSKWGRNFMMFDSKRDFYGK